MAHPLIQDFYDKLSDIYKNIGKNLVYPNVDEEIKEEIGSLIETVKSVYLPKKTLEEKLETQDGVNVGGYYPKKDFAVFMLGKILPKFEETIKKIKKEIVELPIPNSGLMGLFVQYETKQVITKFAKDLMHLKNEFSNRATSLKEDEENAERQAIQAIQKRAAAEEKKAKEEEEKAKQAAKEKKDLEESSQKGSQPLSEEQLAAIEGRLLDKQKELIQQELISLKDLHKQQLSEREGQIEKQKTEISSLQLQVAAAAQREKEIYKCLSELNLLEYVVKTNPLTMKLVAKPKYIWEEEPRAEDKEADRKKYAIAKAALCTTRLEFAILMLLINYSRNCKKLRTPKKPDRYKDELYDENLFNQLFFSIIWDFDNLEAQKPVLEQINSQESKTLTEKLEKGLKFKTQQVYEHNKKKLQDFVDHKNAAVLKYNEAIEKGTKKGEKRDLLTIKELKRDCLKWLFSEGGGLLATNVPFNKNALKYLATQKTGNQTTLDAGLYKSSR